MVSCRCAREARWWGGEEKPWCGAVRCSESEARVDGKAARTAASGDGVGCGGLRLMLLESELAAACVGELEEVVMVVVVPDGLMGRVSDRQPLQ